MGGFTSLPPVYAGHKMGLKTFIHDSNAVPAGPMLTSRFCTQVLLGMEAAKRFPTRETVTTGTPCDRKSSTCRAARRPRRPFGLDPQKDHHPRHWWQPGCAPPQRTLRRGRRLLLR